PFQPIGPLPLPRLPQRAAYAMLRRLLRDETWRPVFRPCRALQAALPTARLLHAHFGEAGLAALPIARRSRLPLITSFHGRDVAKPAARHYGRRLYRPLFTHGAAFTVVSHHMRDQLITLGAPAERIHLVRTGIDPAGIPFAPRSPGSNGVRLLSIGRLVEKKGIHVAIAAVARLHHRYAGLTLTIIGDGPLRATLEAQAQAAGVGRQVHFCGAQPAARVLAELAAADLFVLPCLTAADGDQEGAPVVLMEALAAGLPVVSTHHAAIAEIVQHDVSGLLAHEGDTEELSALLERLLQQPERWPAMGAAGRRHVVETFDLNRAVAALEQVYDQVARQGEQT
ncbi:MAG TPA: glycosyltransferase, partial [Roseiflexaceae bacterium]|nr:glycosyltransferase [Roseiflexaceae bacterium]